MLAPRNCHSHKNVMFEEVLCAQALAGQSRLLCVDTPVDNNVPGCTDLKSSEAPNVDPVRRLSARD